MRYCITTKGKAMSKSWKPVVQADNTGKWYDNALRFRTKEEALQSATDLAMRWMAVREYDAHESEDEPNREMVKDDAGRSTMREISKEAS
jgi:hypothetical protein